MTQDQPSRLDRLETIVGDIGEVVLQISEVTQANSVAIAQLTNRVDALTTSTTEAIQLIAQNSRQIARNNDRIEQILEYLFRERPNGRGDG